MFKLAKTQTFRSPVTIETQDDKGRVLKETVHCTYNRPSEQDCKDWQSRDNAEVMAQWLVNVEGMTNEEADGSVTQVPFEGEYREAFLRHPPATYAAATVFWQVARTGKVKN